MVPIRRPSEFIRLGAWCAVMPAASQAPRNDAGGSVGRPAGRVSRSRGASDALDDGSPSPARNLLPRERETQSYGHHMSEPDHLLDENIGRRGSELLKAAGHDVMTVRDQDLRSPASRPKPR